MAPMKEMLRLPTNARNFGRAFVNPPHRPGFNMNEPRARGLFSRLISGIDESATDALRRAGVPQEQIERLLLTAENDLSAVGGNTWFGRLALPFQRTPANVIREGFRELDSVKDGVTRQKPFGAREALTVASVPAGTVLGDWVRDNPKMRGPLAAILVAAAGPRTLPMTAGGMLGASGYGRSALGGLSPVPEFAFDPKTMSGIPPAGVKLFQRLFGQD